VPVPVALQAVPGPSLPLETPPVGSALPRNRGPVAASYLLPMRQAHTTSTPTPASQDIQLQGCLCVALSKFKWHWIIWL